MLDLFIYMIIYYIYISFRLYIITVAVPLPGDCHRTTFVFHADLDPHVVDRASITTRTKLAFADVMFPRVYTKLELEIYIS